MAFIGKIFFSVLWVFASIYAVAIFNFSDTQGLWMFGIGLALIFFWGTIKRVISDHYEDNRHHRNRRKQLEIEMEAMERRINATIAEQRAGHDRTMQLMQFRQQLLKMESEENDAMIRAMVSTLDSVNVK